MRVSGFARFPFSFIVLLMMAASLAAAAQPPAESAEPVGGAWVNPEGVAEHPLSLHWFFFGLYVLAGVIFAGACAHQAVHRALSPVRWFFAGLFLNAVGYLILLTRAPGDARAFHAGIPRGFRKVPRTFDSVECPCCGGHNHPAGRHCPGCGAEMHPRFDSEAARWRRQARH